MPILLHNGTAHVTTRYDWAREFMRGMGVRHDGWAEFVNDDKYSGCLIPMIMLRHEHDGDS